MKRHAIINVADVIPVIPSGTLKTLAVVGGYEVKIGGLRLTCFKEHGLECVDCGRAGSFFAIESHGCERPHLNMYDKEGVLMTRDHIIARADGGPDTLENSQTMCEPCNQRKGSEKDRRR